MEWAYTTWYSSCYASNFSKLNISRIFNEEPIRDIGIRVNGYNHTVKVYILVRDWSNLPITLLSKEIKGEVIKTLKKLFHVEALFRRLSSGYITINSTFENLKKCFREYDIEPSVLEFSNLTGEYKPCDESKTEGVCTWKILYTTFFESDSCYITSADGKIEITLENYKGLQKNIFAEMLSRLILENQG